MALFEPHVVLSRDMDTAFARGRFEEAVRLRLILEAAYGRSHDDLAFLDRLGGRLWDGPASVALAVWREIDADLGGRPHLRARLRDGVFARLLESHAPEALAETEPGCLPALALVLSTDPQTSAEGGRRRARGLIRDALLAGRVLPSLDFTHDGPVADLLAEDFSPRWLACLGALRRLWPVSQPVRFGAKEVHDAAGDDRTNDAAALEFWQCLGTAESAECAEELLHEARRRMKQLRPEFHALYMMRAGRRSSSIARTLNP